jgi:hypothetical protein
MFFFSSWKAINFHLLTCIQWMKNIQHPMTMKEMSSRILFISEWAFCVNVCGSFFGIVYNYDEHKNCWNFDQKISPIFHFKGIFKVMKQYFFQFAVWRGQKLFIFSSSRTQWTFLWFVYLGFEWRKKIGLQTYSIIRYRYRWNE